MPMSINSPTKPKRILPPGAGDARGAFGVALTMKVTGAQSDGRFLVLEYTAPPQPNS